MRKGIWIAVFLLSFAPLSALKPPLYHTLDEFKALIEDPQLPGKLDSSQAIQSIVRTEQGFEVTTNKAVLPVNVVNEPAPKGWVGPAKFHLEFQEAVGTQSDK